MEPQPPKQSRVGRILLVNLGIIVVLHLGRQLLDSSAGIFVVLFIMAIVNFVLFLLALFDADSRKNSVGFLLAALLVFLIGFGDCATHLKLGSMN